MQRLASPTGDSEPTVPCWGQSEAGRQAAGARGCTLMFAECLRDRPCPASPSCLSFHEAGHFSPFSIRGPPRLGSCVPCQGPLASHTLPPPSGGSLVCPENRELGR